MKKVGQAQLLRKLKNQDLSSMFVYGLLFIIFIAASIATPVFLKPRNLSNVFLLQPVGFGIICMAQMIILISGGLDLSVGSALSLSVTLTAGLYKANPDTPLALAFLLPIGIGLAVGLINGTVVVGLKINPFMATFATSSVYQGLALMYSKKTMGGIPKSFRFIAEGKLAGIPMSIILFVAVAILVYLLLRRHKTGVHIFAVGSDPYVSSISGLPVRRVKFFAYVAGGILVGIASIFLAARLGGGGPIVGKGYELDSITANAIGGVSLAGGVGSIAGVIGGVLVITIFSNVLNLLNTNPYLQVFLKGLILVIAVLFSAKKKN